MRLSKEKYLPYIVACSAMERMRRKDRGPADRSRAKPEG
jgi:hypothetical protein